MILLLWPPELLQLQARASAPLPNCLKYSMLQNTMYSIKFHCYRPGWSAIAQSQLTATSASRVQRQSFTMLARLVSNSSPQVIRPPQTPKGVVREKKKVDKLSLLHPNQRELVGPYSLILTQPVSNDNILPCGQAYGWLFVQKIPHPKSEQGQAHTLQPHHLVPFLLPLAF
ncbi:hypothetical protein AAY473_035469 [Plecturocebus cupreus]